jgi:hypothetical protein
MRALSDSPQNLKHIQVMQRNLIAAKVRCYCVVKVFIGLVTPSLLPLESIDSTV